MLLACGVISLTVLSNPAAAEPWTRFRGPGGLGTVPDASVPVKWSDSENIQWKTDLPGRGASSPVWYEGRVYLTYFKGEAPEGIERYVACLELASGKAVWQKGIPSRLPEETRNREDHGYTSSTPLVDADRVYAFFGKSGVHALDHDGKPLWKADVGSGTSGWGSAASPIAFESLVIVNACVESSTLRALEKATGREVWRVDGIKESWNTPIIVDVDGEKELVFAVIGKVLGLDPKTGKRLWECATDIGWYMAPSLVAHDGVVYAIGGRQGGALAVRAGGRGDVTASRRLWKISKGSNVTSPIYHAGRLYWAHENIGVLYCVNAENGEVIYEHRLPRAGQIYASPVLAGDHLYFFNRYGRAFVVEAGDSPGKVRVNDLEDFKVVNSSPVICGDRMLIRSDKSLVCIGE